LVVPALLAYGYAPEPIYSAMEAVAEGHINRRLEDKEASNED